VLPLEVCVSPGLWIASRDVVDLDSVLDRILQSWAIDPELLPGEDVVRFIRGSIAEQLESDRVERVRVKFRRSEPPMLSCSHMAALRMPFGNAMIGVYALDRLFGAALGGGRSALHLSMSFDSYYREWGRTDWARSDLFSNFARCCSVAPVDAWSAEYDVQLWKLFKIGELSGQIPRQFEVPLTRYIFPIKIVARDVALKVSRAEMPDAIDIDLGDRRALVRFFSDSKDEAFFKKFARENGFLDVHDPALTDWMYE
jgi:hypothetical protein